MDYVLIEMIHQILHRCWFNGIVMGSYRIMEQTIGLMCSNPQISEAWWFYFFFDYPLMGPTESEKPTDYWTYVQ